MVHSFRENTLSKSHSSLNDFHRVLHLGKLNSMIDFFHLLNYAMFSVIPHLFFILETS